MHTLPVAGDPQCLFLWSPGDYVRLKHIDGRKKLTLMSTADGAKNAACGASKSSESSVPRVAAQVTANTLGWSSCVSGKSFDVRCPPRSLAEKAPSADSLYDAVYFDRRMTKERVPRARDLWDLSKVIQRGGESPSVPEGIVPEFVVLHVQVRSLPFSVTHPPSL